MTLSDPPAGIARRQLLLVALAVAAAAGTAAAARWRYHMLRDGVRARAATRMSSATALGRDAAAMWVRELTQLARYVGAGTPALPAGATPQALAPRVRAPGVAAPNEGFTSAWVTTGEPAAQTGDALVPAERRAAALASRDRRVHVVGPFRAATRSGLAVAFVAPTAATAGGAPSAVVLRADPAQTVLPFVARRAPSGSEVARLVVRDGDRVFVVAPGTPPSGGAAPAAAGPTHGYTLAEWRLADVSAPARAALGFAPRRAPGPAAYRTPDGRQVLAVYASVSGTPWVAERQVEAAEVDASAQAAVRTEVLLVLTGLTAAGLGGLAVVRTERARQLRELVGLAAQREAGAEALRASEASAQTFVEHSPYGICRVAPDGRFTSVNPALVEILGYPDADALMQADLGEIYVDPAARAEVLRRHARGEATVDNIETEWRCHDGGTVPVRLHSREVRDADGRIVYYEAFVNNLAALRSAEQALRQAEKLAAVGGFVSGVAHELNNPLSAVLLFTDGLLDDGGRPADDREALTLVREQALRARAIVRDLLAFVRGAGGTTALVRARDVLDAAVRALTPQVAAAGAQLDVTLPADLGWLQADRSSIEQVVTNLVINAVHAAPGGVVSLTATRDRAMLHLTVADDGPGLPPDVLRRMFEPFFTTKPVGVGTGLGLSVSLGIVERHGGTLVAANRPASEGTGARLTVTLPLAARPADASAPPAADPPPADEAQIAAAFRTGASSATSDGGADRPALAHTPRVLVVDDEAPIRLALHRFFERRGWAVDEAGDGRAAFARLLDAEAAGTPYDLVLSDVRMPDVSGVVLHDWLARTRPALLDRLVFATGDLASPESASFVARTRCQVLEKPFEPAALDALARRALAARPDGAPPDNPEPDRQPIAPGATPHDV